MARTTRRTNGSGSAGLSADPSAFPDLEVAGAPAPSLRPELRREIAELRLASADPVASAAKLTAIIAAAALGVVAAVVVDHPVVWVLSVLVTTGALCSLAFAEHEALHGSLFDSRRANHGVGILCGALTLVPYSAYRSYHLQHHRATHAPGDTEPAPVLSSRPRYVAAVALAMVGFSGELCYQLARSVTGRPLSWARRTRRPGLDLASAIGVVAGPVVVVLATIQGHGTTVLLGWVVPAVLALMVGGLFASAEHYECDYGPGSIFDLSRTIRTNRVMRFLMWNGNFHTAHHLVPAVTGRNLPQLQGLIEDDCRIVERSYWSFHRGLWGRIGRGELPSPPPWVGSAEGAAAATLTGTSERTSA